MLEGYWNYGNTRIASVAMVGGEYGVLTSDSDPLRYENENDPNDPNNDKPILTWNEAFRCAGTTVLMINGFGETVTNDVSGMSYQEAYEAGLVEPVHASHYTFRSNSWSRGVINDNVLQENSYIGFRQMTISYRIPSSLISKLKISSADISLIGRDLLNS